MIEITITLESKEMPKKKGKKLHIFRLMGCIMIPLVLIGMGSYFLYGAYRQYESKKQATIQSAINEQLAKSKTEALSDDTGDPFERYSKEINAVVPFDKTEWRSIPVVVYNFIFTYPTNTTALVRNSDGTEIWFLRRDGYMMRIQLFQSNDTPQQWYDALSNKDKYTATPTKLGQQNVLFMQQIDRKADVVGDQYIFSHKGYIYQVWYQVYDSTIYPDDVKRIERMLNSLVFI